MFWFKAIFLVVVVSFLVAGIELLRSKRDLTDIPEYYDFEVDIGFNPRGKTASAISMIILGVVGLVVWFLWVLM